MIYRAVLLGVWFLSQTPNSVIAQIGSLSLSGFGTDPLLEAIDSTTNVSGRFRYTVVSDSSVIPDSLNTPLRLPYPLYRSLFNQARIRRTTVASTDGLYAADSALLDEVLQDTLLQSIDRRVVYDIQIPRPRIKSDVPMFSLLFGTLAVFAFTRRRYGSYMNLAIQTFFNVNLARQFYDDFGFANSAASFLLSLNTILIFGSIIFLSLQNLAIAVPLPDTLCLVACFLGIGILFFLKRMSLRLLSVIALPTHEVINFYLFNRDIIVNTAATALLPFSVIAAFARPELAQWAWLVSVVVMGLTFVYSYYRGLQVVKDFVWYHKFHFLLYLCTFEIAPPFIIVKLLHS